MGRHSGVIRISAKKVLEDLKIGDSVAVNGICLTVIALHPGSFSADVMHETLKRSAFSSLRTGRHVNLERAMPVNGRFGGHIVAGHVDGVGRIIFVKRDDRAVWYSVQADPSLMKYIVEKGSIAVDGISLTVADVRSDSFSISAIPHTVEETLLKEKKEGDVVNLETDIVGKYIEKFLSLKTPERVKSRIDRDFLTKYGF